MRKLLKRFAAAASAVVIGGVSCVTTWFSVPVSAAAGVGWLEWLEFQSLLQGIGVGGNNSDFADSVQDWIDGIGGAEMPREDYDGEWMTNYEYYNRVGWDEIIDWFDGLFSGDNAYSDIADVGTGSSSPKFSISDDGTSVCINDLLYNGYGSQSSPFVDSSGSKFYIDAFHEKPLVSSDIFLASNKFILYCTDGIYFIYDNVLVDRFDWNTSECNFWYHLSSSSGGFSGVHWPGDKSFSSFRYDHPRFSSSQISEFLSMLSDFGINLKNYDGSFESWISSFSDVKYNPVDGFIGPVYTYPAAQELYKSTGTASGIRLDVQTQDGVPDVQAALDGAGVKTVDDLVAGVAAGTVPMTKVFSDAKVTPYVVADTTSGTVVTDLGVSATAAGVKSVGLTQDLAVPKDLNAAATYSIKGKTWDPEMSKYKLPLFEYFPFCLPWDIYQVLAAFSADPVAPVFDVPVGKILSGVRSVDASKAASVSAKIDFGDDNWSKVFEIIRILECAGIIVGLCLVAVYLIHGGR